MSDIHGEYDKYIKMLELIGFGDDDTLYVLGDVVDRGKEPVKVLLDMMNRPNIYPLMGNHDLLALHVLKKLNVEITEENYATQVDMEVLNILADWLGEGGSTTMKRFRELPMEKRMAVLEYMEEFPYYDIAETDDKIFILVHAGLGNYRKNKKLSQYSPEELVCGRTDPEIRFYDDDDVFVVMGHTPTVHFHGRTEIYRNGNNIFIDCGACFDGGRLGCLCLDTMEEFYV